MSSEPISTTPISTTLAVASRIRDARKELGLNQTEFANALGVSRGHLSEVENDGVKIPVDILFKIAECFERKTFKASVYWLVTGDNRPVPWGENPSTSPLNSVLGLEERALVLALRVLGMVTQDGDAPEGWERKARLLRQVLYHYTAEVQRECQAGTDVSEAREKAERACLMFFGVLGNSSGDESIGATSHPHRGP